MNDPRLSKLPRWALEHIQKITHKAGITAALRWTELVLPDVPPPQGGSELTKGWLPCFDRVERACSSCMHHSVGNDERTTTHGARSLFSSKLLALKALRREVEMRSAEALLRVDRQIEAEENNSKP